MNETEIPTTEIASFTGLSDSDLSAATEALAKLAARATKARIPGADTLKLSVVKSYTITVKDEDWGIISSHLGHDVVVTGSIGLGGKVVGVVTWAAEGIEFPGGLLAKFGTEATLPTATRTCAHCGYNRNRNITVMIDVDGKIAEYGTDCTRLVAGIDATDAVASVLTTLANIALGDEDEMFGGGGRSTHPIALAAFLKVCYAAILASGYVRASDWGSTSTGTLAYDLLNNLFSKKKDDREWEKAIVAKAEDVSDEMVAGALDYITNMTGGDYASNVKAAAAPGFVGRKGANLLASAVFGYTKDVEKRAVAAAEKKAPIVAEIIAPVGTKKVPFTGKVIFITGYESDFGSGRIVKILTDTNHVLVWFSSSNPAFALDLNEDVKGTCTVKGFENHPTYGASTTVKMVKFL